MYIQCLYRTNRINYPEWMIRNHFGLSHFVISPLDALRWNRRCFMLQLGPQWRKSLVEATWSMRCSAQPRSAAVKAPHITKTSLAWMTCLTVVLLATLGRRVFAGLPVSCVVLLQSSSAHFSWAGAPEDQNHRGERSATAGGVLWFYGQYME